MRWHCDDLREDGADKRCRQCRYEFKPKVRGKLPGWSDRQLAVVRVAQARLEESGLGLSKGTSGSDVLQNCVESLVRRLETIKETNPEILLDTDIRFARQALDYASLSTAYMAESDRLAARALAEWLEGRT